MNEIIESTEANPYKDILTQLLLHLEFRQLPIEKIPEFLSEQFKKHSIVVGIYKPAERLGLIITKKSKSMLIEKQ